jgi:hypothetical protein
MFAQDRRELLHELRQVGEVLALLTAGVHRDHYVEAALNDTAKIRKPGLDLGPFVPAGPDLFQRPALQAFEIAGFGQVGQSGHRPARLPQRRQGGSAA